MTRWWRRLNDRLTNIGLSAAAIARLHAHNGGDRAMLEVATGLRENLHGRVQRRHAEEPTPAELAERAARLFARGPRA